ncbi:hypothetical protein NO004_530022 [Flavobacterium psychrophilum]|nr:hypothetical protein NO004_530022 [Flavobacterium psychrophilum]
MNCKEKSIDHQVIEQTKIIIGSRNNFKICLKINLCSVLLFFM